MLGEHVERVLRDRRLLDLGFAHAPGDDRALEQVAAVFREDPAFRDFAEPVPGAADPLQAAGHRLRRLDLDDQVDGAHVDPQLQRGGGDQARQFPRLEELLDQGSLLVGERAVVGAGDLLVGHRLAGVLVAGIVVAGVLGSGELALRNVVMQLVQALRQALGGAAVVDEDDRRVVGLDQAQQLRVDRRPDRAHVGARLDFGRRRPVLARVGGRPRVRHVLDRHDDLEIQLLALPRVDDLALPFRPDEESRNPLQRPLRGRKPDALNFRARTRGVPRRGFGGGL